MSDSPILSCEKLCKRFHDGGLDVSVLNAVDLVVKKAELLAIVGASGSGKSTLLQLLGGLDTPTSGSVRWEGQSISGMKDRELSSLRNHFMGFIYQFHHLLPEFNVLENVAMPLWVGKVDSSLAKEKAADLLEKVGMSHRLKHRVAQLSGGERQRVAIARSLVMSPSLVLADEPTGNLDFKTANQITDLILSLNDSLKTCFVVVTHNQVLAARMNRSLLVDAGSLTAI